MDDLRSFREAIHDPIVVYATEMARLLCNDPYEESYRYSRDSGVNIVRGAHWDVFLYTNTRDSVGARGVKKAKMAIICVPPWDLSKLDLHDFAVPRTVSEEQMVQMYPANKRNFSSPLQSWTLSQVNQKLRRCIFCGQS